jgi:hypothetical protein
MAVRLRRAMFRAWVPSPRHYDPSAIFDAQGRPYRHTDVCEKSVSARRSKLPVLMRWRLQP